MRAEFPLQERGNDSVIPHQGFCEDAVGEITEIPNTGLGTEQHLVPVNPLLTTTTPRSDGVVFNYCDHHYHGYDYPQARTAASPPPGPQVVGFRSPRWIGSRRGQREEGN